MISISPSESIIHDVELDVRGLTCPLPLLKAKLALNSLSSGQILKVLVTDAASQRDFRSFAQLSGHALVREAVQTEPEAVYLYWLCKA